MHYALERREALSLYLDDPDVPIEDVAGAVKDLIQAHWKRTFKSSLKWLKKQWNPGMAER